MNDVRGHLEDALEALEADDTPAGRYHVREAVQLLEAIGVDADRE